MNAPHPFYGILSNGFHLLRNDPAFFLFLFIQHVEGPDTPLKGLVEINFQLIPVFTKLSDYCNLKNNLLNHHIMKRDKFKLSISVISGIIALAMLVVTGCNTSTKKQDEPAVEKKKVPKEEVIRDLAGYPIPDSYEITKMIYESGAPYILSLSNSAAKAGDYITHRDKVLNLGVYATDLCYATTYMMKQGTLNYLEASKTLIDDLGISTTFNIDYAARIEKNLDDRDSLITIVSESFGDTWNYLVENEQDVLARLVVCGSWIEGIYITTNVASRARDNDEIMVILAKQKNSLDELVRLLESVKDVEEVVDIYNGLYDLQAVYTDVDEALTAEQLERISAKIAALRSTIV